MHATIETYQSIISTKIGRVAANLLPKKISPRMRLIVQSGLHEGYAMVTAAPSVTIGSSHNCDLVLLDDGIEDTHATLEFDTTFLGDAVRVNSPSADICLAGETYLAKRTSSYETSPTRLALGNVKIRIESETSQTRQKGAFPSSPGVLTRLTKICGICIFLLFLPLLLSFGANPGNSLLVSLNPLNADTRTENASAADSLAALETELEKNGLSNALKVRQATPTIVIVEGKLPEAKMADWQSVHRWFDQQPHSLLLTSLVKSAPALDNFPAIASIRLHPNPEVKFTNGQSKSIGEVVVDGWAIEALNDTELSLIRNGERIVIAL